MNLCICFADTFMSDEIAEFEIGKRHLANIMGADPDNFSQEDIDVNIIYFFSVFFIPVTVIELETKWLPFSSLLFPC